MLVTETIIGSLKGLTGHAFDIVYDLFFTTSRVIAVIIRHPGDVDSHETSLTSLILGNLPEKRKAQIEQGRISRERRKASQEAAPEELLSQNSLNFAILYSEITSVDIKRDFFQWQIRFHMENPEKSRQITFTMNKDQVREARRILEQVLPAKLKGK